MNPHYYFANPANLRLFRFVVFVALTVAAPAALADLNCHYFAGDGWRIGSMCISDFDDNGNYVSTWCRAGG